MTLQGCVKNGVVVLASGATLPEGTLVQVIPVAEVASPSNVPPGQKPPYPVSREQQAALLSLIGTWKVEHPPNDEEVKRIIDEYRMKKYG